MFLLRLKTEFSENLKTMLALWAILGLIAWSFFDWWNGPMAKHEGALGAFAVLAAGLIVLMLVGTMFKRDDLKLPEEFWTTRPIRAGTLFGTKFVFALLSIVLPVGMLMTTTGFMAGVGMSAVWNGLEIMLWASFALSLLGLSAMAYPGGNRALLGVFCFFGGVILTSVVLTNGPVERMLRSYWMNGPQMQWNLLVVLLLLTTLFTWQCLRQIRDKHIRQSPLVLIATGILTVLLITFVPLPGGFAAKAIQTSSTTLPTVTKAEVDPMNLNYGVRHGAKFISMNIQLMPEENLLGEAFEFDGTNLKVVGASDVPQQVDMGHMALAVHDSSGQMVTAKPVLSYYVFDSQPGSGSRSSSGSDHDKTKILGSLPRQKVRVLGTVSLSRITYRTIHRGPLDQPFEKNERGMKIAFLTTPNHVTGHESSAIWKSYSPPLATARSTRRLDPVRFRLEHGGTGGRDWYNRLEGGGSGGGAFFGAYQDNNLRISDHDIESNYYWRELKESGYNKSVKEWKQEAELICEVKDQVHPLILPVDIEVEVPDPEKVRELLLQGTL